MLAGYQFGSWTNGETPYDHVADPVTGIRPKQSAKPNGVSWSSLRSNGIENATIPPLAIWRDGFWLDEWEKATDLKEGAAPKTPAQYEERNIYVCSGEGTPSNYQWRMYEVPDEIAASQQPRHPLMWPKKLKEKKPWTLTKPAATAPPPQKPKTASIPHDVHFRCPLCGHWFKGETKLSTHVQFACAGQSADGQTDWAIMCAEECGCTTLDEVAVCKPGFPKGKVLTEQNDEGEENATDEENETEEKEEEPVAEPETSEINFDEVIHNKLVTPDVV